jgi:hypothetical protein
LVDFTRAFSRAVVIAEAEREQVGFVREEQLAALVRQIDKLHDLEKTWTRDVVLRILRGEMAALAEAILDHVRATTGLRGLFSRLGREIENNLQDIVHGIEAVAT